MCGIVLYELKQGRCAGHRRLDPHGTWMGDAESLRAGKQKCSQVSKSSDAFFVEQCTYTTSSTILVRFCILFFSRVRLGVSCSLAAAVRLSVFTWRASPSTRMELCFTDGRRVSAQVVGGLTGTRLGWEVWSCSGLRERRLVERNELELDC